MTVPTPAAPLPALRVGPIARLSRGALERNARVLRSRDEELRVDLTADGWGHGAAFLTAAAGEFTPSDAAASDNEALLGLASGFEPVLTLVGTVLSTKALRAGEGVSYGYRHRAASDTTVALVTGGYAQGILRALGGHAEVGIGARRHPIVGRIAMDVCVVDVGEAAVRAGDEVVFLGEGFPVSAWARATGLHSAELITAIALRAPHEVRP